MPTFADIRNHERGASRAASRQSAREVGTGLRPVQLPERPWSARAAPLRAAEASARQRAEHADATPADVNATLAGAPAHCRRSVPGKQHGAGRQLARKYVSTARERTPHARREKFARANRQLLS
jgi:hypothetical protein